MDNKIKIGFFDSGVGGISVMSHAKNKIKNADFIYYADTKHVPYGNKTREEIIKYSDDAINYLTDQGVCCAVVACNTATSMAIDYLRNKYDIPIVGMEPAVKPASLAHHGEKILVCATPVTIAGEKLHTLIDKSFNGTNYPTLVAAPKLVTFAENAEFNTDTVCEYLKSIIDINEKYTAVVLGCTHFSYFKDSFKKLFGNIDMIDGTEGTVNHLIDLLQKSGFQVNSDREIGKIKYVASGEVITDKKILDYYSALEKRSFID